MFLAAQVSIYPLCQPDLSQAIDVALDVFKKYDLEVTAGAMSSVISGEDEILFSAIKEAMQKTSEQSEIVMVATFSNACPVSKHS